MGNTMQVEQAIQEYFNERITPTFKALFRHVGDMVNYFGSPSIRRSPLDQKRMIQPDIIHMKNESDSDMQYPEIVFGIGDYKTGIYKMTQGFEEFKTAILNRRRLRLNSIGIFFPDREWLPIVLLELALGKYIYQVFLCGTDRILTSDHQTFSEFFKYEIMNGKMFIYYCVINGA
ncbi:unnamed protein product [Debaryomyces tyrocola]|nr:unnamed protein product [Debaryomyces tyrocola]